MPVIQISTVSRVKRIFWSFHAKDAKKAPNDYEYLRIFASIKIRSYSRTSTNAKAWSDEYLFYGVCVRVSVVVIRCEPHAASSRWTRLDGRHHTQTWLARSTISSFTTLSASSA